MRCMFLLLVIVGLSGLTGCQGPTANLIPVEVIIAGDGEFPASLAGTWKADRNRWEITFEEDGTISNAVITMGTERIIPGQTKTIPLKKGGKGIYEPGQWTVQYSPDTRELIVNIVMAHIRLEMDGQILDGKTTDTFMGNVSEDGKTWTAIWSSFPDYTAYVPNPVKLGSDPDDGPQGILKFTKIE